MKKIIKSKDFILRPFKKGDEKSIIKNINDKYIYKHTAVIPYPYKPKHAKQWITHCKRVAKKKKKTEIRFAIDIHGEVIGGIGFKEIKNKEGELGYWIGKKYRGKGVITKAIRLITCLGFNELKLKRIHACIFLKNKASIRVLEKNGYKRGCKIKKCYKKDGKYIDAIPYSKIK